MFEVVHHWRGLGLGLGSRLCGVESESPEKGARGKSKHGSGR
jgi:hypothetical protein